MSKYPTMSTYFFSTPLKNKFYYYLRIDSCSKITSSLVFISSSRSSSHTFNLQLVFIYSLFFKAIIDVRCRVYPFFLVLNVKLFYI